MELYNSQTNKNFGIRESFFAPTIDKTLPPKKNIVLISTAIATILSVTNLALLESERTFIKPVAESQRLDIHRQDLLLIANIREKSTYDNNWDGNGAKKASQATISDAEKFIRILLKSTPIHAPIISLAADGEINFLWVLDDFRFDLGFYGDKTFSYYGKKSDGAEFMSDETNITDSLPSEIINLIRK